MVPHPAAPAEAKPPNAPAASEGNRQGAAPAGLHPLPAERVRDAGSVAPLRQEPASPAEPGAERPATPAVPVAQTSTKP